MAWQILVVLSLFLCCSTARFQAKDGNLIECVDINKQPSLRHPLLKDHNIQLHRHRSEKCPPGTVPIFTPRFGLTDVHPLSPAFEADYVAALRTKSGGKYHGASAVMSVHNPPFKGKFSKSQVWVENGPSQELNSIQFGWAIHPELYGDTMTRFTIYWTGDGYKMTGCYNTLCPGFVQDFSDLYPGKAFDPVSIDGGKQVLANLSLTQDSSTGHWWVSNRGMWVGYFPKELFTHLRDGATFVQYGAVSAKSREGANAPMGNGRSPKESNNDLSKSSYFKSIGLVDANFNSVPISDDDVSVDAKSPKCFPLNYLKNKGSDIGHAFTYGGPGGSCNP